MEGFSWGSMIPSLATAAFSYLGQQSANNRADAAAANSNGQLALLRDLTTRNLAVGDASAQTLEGAYQDYFNRVGTTGQLDPAAIDALARQYFAAASDQRARAARDALGSLTATLPPGMGDSTLAVDARRALSESVGNQAIKDYNDSFTNALSYIGGLNKLRGADLQEITGEVTTPFQMRTANTAADITGAAYGARFGTDLLTQANKDAAGSTAAFGGRVQDLLNQAGTILGWNKDNKKSLVVGADSVVT